MTISIDHSPERLKLARVRPAADCTQEDNILRQEEIGKCKASFVYFLKNYVKVPVLPKPGESGVSGMVPFEFTPHMKKAVIALAGIPEAKDAEGKIIIPGVLPKKSIIWMKSRQVWASTLMSAYDLWYALFQELANVMVMSKGKDEAAEKIRKSRLVYTNLPDWMRLPIDPDSATEMRFPARESGIKAFPATETAGISYTASVVDSDELAAHPYAEENLQALQPCRDAGGQYIGTFTPSVTGDTMAEVIFRDAIDWPNFRLNDKGQIISKSRNGYYPLFDGWKVVPGRTQAWYDAVKKSIPVMELSFLSPEVFMRKAYPETIEEALSSESSITAFDHSVLDSMMGDVKKPVEGTFDIDRSICHVYKENYIGSSYIAASDTSHGTGGDYSVTVVLNAKTGEVVADLMSKVISVEEFTYQSTKLLKIYNNPKWGIEANDWGGATIAKADELGYKNFIYQDEKKTKIGFMTGAKNRDELWGELIAGINNRQITIYNPDGIRQLMDCIRNKEKQGRIEARAGGHDDYPMTLGIAWLKRSEAISTEWKPTHIESLHFSGNSGAGMYEPGTMVSRRL